MERVLITGGTGVIGSRLQMHLAQAGYYSVILTRDETKSRADKAHAHWDVNQGQIDDHALEVDHVINLVGAGIAEKKWTSSRKKVLLDSRVNTTRFLINQFRKRGGNLQSFISASAIGYYGDGGDQVLTEDTGIVTQEFLSDVCEAWEAAAAPAEDISNRLVIYRISTVLNQGSGALAKMDATIPFGVANYLGSGEQYFSWIHIDDLCRAIVHALKNDTMTGIYNACSTPQMTNKEFTTALRDVVNAKALLLPAPAFGIKMVFGEMARVVLNSSRVSGQKLAEAGFKCTYSDALSALRDIYA